ncbi:MAG: hypothetical protein V3U68_06665, partial [Bacteroidota bacterium]
MLFTSNPPVPLRCTVFAKLFLAEDAGADRCSIAMILAGRDKVDILQGPTVETELTLSRNFSPAVRTGAVLFHKTRDLFLELDATQLADTRTFTVFGVADRANQHHFQAYFTFSEITFA